MDESKMKYAVVQRRWTDELTRSGTTSRGSGLVQDGKNIKYVEEERSKQLFECPSQDDESFEVVNIAREELGKMIARFDTDTKLSSWPKLGSSKKSAKAKVAEVLHKSAESEIDDLKSSVESLGLEWKQKHGPVFAAFKKICSTLDDHKSILKVFPSQNNYTSPLVGSVTILMKAAQSHSEISLKLSTSIAEISEKVSICSNVLSIVKTARARKKLAAIYARMFDFYRAAISWYMQSSFGRLMRSFNENLVKEFEDAKKDLEVDVVELYREVAIANTAMVAMVNGRVRSLEDELHRQRRNYEVRDMLAGQRMERILQATWTNVEQVKSMIASATLSKPAEIVQNLVVHPPACGSIYNPRHNLDAFIIDKEQLGFSGKADLWVSEKDIIHKLRLWMTDNTKSRTLWISSPYKPGVAVPSCRAAVMATIAAAWQAETPIISYSCSRPSRNQLRPGMNVEQVGMISLVYGFIRQLSQFSRVDEEFENHDDDFAALNGEVSSWDASLRLLKILLRKAPVVTFCVIENLNDLEWNNGGVWCKQLLDVLRECQREAGVSFNILYSTTGQSRVLPAYVSVKDRHMTSSRS